MTYVRPGKALKEASKLSAKVARKAAQLEARLESEGLGVFDPSERSSGVNFHRSASARGRKHAYLEGRLMGTDWPHGSPERISPSPFTAQAVEFRMAIDNEDLVFHAGNMLIQDLEIQRSNFERSADIFGSLEDEMVEAFNENEDYSYGESALDQLAWAMTATRKEAEIADRKRGTVLGLDAAGSPRHPTQPRLTIKQKADNILARRAGKPEPHNKNPYFSGEATKTSETRWAPLRCDYFKKEQGLPCAIKDGGNGPLSIKGMRKPEKVSDREEEEVKMSPIVPTMYYHPGRGPYEMTLVAASNSDITG